MLVKYLTLVGLLFLYGGQWCPPLRYWNAHASLPSLDLPGARHVRLPLASLETYRPLTEYLQTHCDTFVTYPGLNSLYFWTGKPPPTQFNVAEIMLLSEHDQNQVVAALKRAKRPLIVLNEQRLFVEESDVLGHGPIAAFVHDHCREINRLGHFRILAPEPTTSNQSSGSQGSLESRL
jgi:hypothetical protein